MNLILALLLAAPAQAGVIASVPRLGPSLIAPVAPSALTPALSAPSLTLDGPRSLNAFWDGVPSAPLLVEPAAIAPLAGIADEPLDQGRLAPWLETSDPKIAAALDAAVETARATRAGRRALDEAEKVLSEQGLTLPVKVAALGRNYGEYDYVEKNIRLHKALFLPGREADLAGTLIHELTHVAQHALGIPSNALEMEIEAHLTDLELLRELGLEPPANTFARQAFDALAESPKKFIALLKSALPGTVFLGDSSLEDVEEQLESDLDEVSARRAKSAAGLAKTIERDLDQLRTPEGKASYKAFSRRVLTLLRRRSAEAKKP